MMITKILVISLAVFVTAASASDNDLCKEEPSCSVFEKAPNGSQEFGNVLRCMCDDPCSKYGDCCLDSTNYESSAVPKYCSVTQSVYMVVTCPATWTDDDVNKKCQKSDKTLKESDTYLIEPVTNIETGITYGNKYCSQCNGDDNVQPWGLTAACGEVPSSYFDSSDVSTSTNVNATSTTDKIYATSTTNKTSSDSSADTSENTYEDDDFVYILPKVGFKIDLENKSVSFKVGSFNATIKAPTIPKLPSLPKFKFKREINPIHSEVEHLRPKRKAKLHLDTVKYAKYLNDIVQNCTWDEKTKHFRSYYKDKNFVCIFSSGVSQAVKPYVRACVANMVSTCSETNNSTIVEKCQSYTALVYDSTTKTPYRNEYCAICNGVAKENLTGCLVRARSALSGLTSTSTRPSSNGAGTKFDN